MTCGYYKPWQIFTVQEGDVLKNYIIRLSDIIFGLTPKDVRRFAHLLAVKNCTRISPSWAEEGTASTNCFANFLKSQTDLPLRKFELINSARMIGFNKENMKQFYDNDSEVLPRHPLGPSKIWNMDNGSNNSTEIPPKNL
jgi:hypothetical protein